MTKSNRWNDAEIQELKNLCKTNEYFMSEIAERLNRKPQTVRWKAHQLGVWSQPRDRMGKWNNKHAHLRKEVLEYYLSHSATETAEHFKLTPSEFKSCLTYAYRQPQLKGIRKEKRPHSAWTDSDWRFMVRYSGVMPREWIAKKLKRGTTYNSVKDALAKFRGLGKYMNGMPVGWAMHFCSKEELDLAIKMKAGPTGCTIRKADFRFRLIPWITLNRIIKHKKQIPDDMKTAISAMARFQCFIHGTTEETKIRSRLMRVCRNYDKRNSKSRSIRSL